MKGESVSDQWQTVICRDGLSRTASRRAGWSATRGRILTLEGVTYEIREESGEPRGSIYGGRDRERGSNRATGEGYREGVRLSGDRARPEGAGERVSVTITMPAQWDKDTALAVLDAYLEGLERGYVLTITEGEGKK